MKRTPPCSLFEISKEISREELQESLARAGERRKMFIAHVCIQWRDVHQKLSKYGYFQTHVPKFIDSKKKTPSCLSPSSNILVFDEFIIDRIPLPVPDINIFSKESK